MIGRHLDELNDVSKVQPNPETPHSGFNMTAKGKKLHYERSRGSSSSLKSRFRPRVPGVDRNDPIQGET